MFHMKPLLICLGCFVSLFFALSGQQQPNPTAVSTPQFSPEHRTPVLVELFTSEGCSSCPPADALLAKLAAQQPVAGAEIVALEEHVDYWNQQGWTDPFSSDQWTARQQKYAATRHDEKIYTPQMIINGRAEFVGSHERQARQEIEQAALQPPTEISIQPLQSEKKDSLRFNVAVAKLSTPSSGDPAEVWLAISESGLHSAVTRGENAGSDVHHADVVRFLRKLGAVDPQKNPPFSAEPTVKLEHSWNRQNLRTIVFLQEKRSLRVLGAHSIRLEP
jgi:hypothetical protein